MSSVGSAVKKAFLGIPKPKIKRNIKICNLKVIMYLYFIPDDFGGRRVAQCCLEISSELTLPLLYSWIVYSYFT